MPHRLLLLSSLQFLLLLSFQLCAQQSDNPSFFRLNKVNPHARNFSDSDIFQIDGAAVYKCFASCPSNVTTLSRPSTPLHGWQPLSLPVQTDSLSSCSLFAFDFVPHHTSGRLFFHLPAVASACHLFLNGTMVGYSEDSFSPAEWDISRYLQSGSNRLLLCVYATSVGSSLDSFPSADTSGFVAPTPGFCQMPFLYRTPWLYISDFRISAAVDSVYSPTLASGRLEVAIDLSNEVRKRYKVSVALVDSSGSDTLLSSSRSLQIRDWFVTFPFSKSFLDSVRLWSPDNPYLYSLHIALRAPSDTVIHSLSVPVGFRSLSVDCHQTYFNKAAIMPKVALMTPPVLARDSLRSVLSNVKSTGINMIRLSHSATSSFYELCDSLGLLVWDCCVLPDKSMLLGYNDDDWLDAYIYRSFNLLHNHRNHTSVVMWGASYATNPVNKSTICPNSLVLQRALSFFNEKDATRPVVLGLSVPRGHPRFGCSCWQSRFVPDAVRSIWYDTLCLYHPFSMSDQQRIANPQNHDTVRHDTIRQEPEVVHKEKKPHSLPRRPSLFRRIFGHKMH